MAANVDTTRSERAVWLMKCPSVVSRSLRSSSSSSNLNSTPVDLPVAKVIVSIDPLRSNDDDSTQFTMELTGTELGNVPKFYSLDMSKDFVPMSVFSESQGKTSVEGKIFNKFDMRPHYNAIDSYGQLCRERTKKYMTKTRQIQLHSIKGKRITVKGKTRTVKVAPCDYRTEEYEFRNSLLTLSVDYATQVIGNDKPIIPIHAMTHVQERKKQPAKSSETKRTRRDRGAMEEIMFKLFEQQPNWTLKELINKTDQPEQFMKDILKDLCVYNNKGANQGSYELKPEYKRSVDVPTDS